MASPRAPVCTRNYWNKNVKIENILYFIEDTGYWRVTLGDGECDLENDQKTGREERHQEAQPGSPPGMVKLESGQDHHKV